MQGRPCSPYIAPHPKGCVLDYQVGYCCWVMLVAGSKW